MAARNKCRTPRLPWWLQRHLGRRAKFAKLKAKYGERCWRCNHPMRFEGPPNCGKAATFEHLMPLAKGGTWALDNLRLCHVGCNRHLADNPPEKKERMRINLPASARREGRSTPGPM